jgi:hypothetical protein
MVKDTAAPFADASIEKKRAVALFSLFSEFCRKYMGMESRGGSSYKKIIDYIFEKKLLSRRGLELMVYLVHQRNVLYKVDKVLDSIVFPIAIHHSRGQSYNIVGITIERYLELWASCRGEPGIPVLELERDSLLIGGHDPLANPPYATFSLDDLATPPAYGTDGERLCAYCGVYQDLSPCMHCASVYYCSSACADNDNERHQCIGALSYLLDAASIYLT